MLKWLKFWRLDMPDSLRFLKVTIWLSIVTAMALTAVYYAVPLHFAGVLFATLIVIAGLPFSLPWLIAFYSTPVKDPNDAEIRPFIWMFGVCWPLAAVIFLIAIRGANAESGTPKGRRQRSDLSLPEPHTEDRGPKLLEFATQRA